MQRPLFKKLSAPIDSVLNGLDTLFNFIPFPIVILIFMAFAFKTNGLKFALLSALSLIFIDLVDLWQETMTTLAMIFTTQFFKKLSFQNKPLPLSSHPRPTGDFLLFCSFARKERAQYCIEKSIGGAFLRAFLRAFVCFSQGRFAFLGALLAFLRPFS